MRVLGSSSVGAVTGENLLANQPIWDRRDLKPESVEMLYTQNLLSEIWWSR
jgi:hypothetical protein